MKFYLVQQRCVFLKGGPRMRLRRNQGRSPRSPPAVSSITEIQEHTTSEILTKYVMKFGVEKTLLRDVCKKGKEE
jgi:hypothetical protein